MATWDNPWLAIKIVADRLGVSETEANKRVLAWMWPHNARVRYCVRWPRADRTFSLPITFLACYGDTEEACLEYIKDGFAGDAKREAVPWLTKYALNQTIEQLTNEPA